MSQEQNDIWYIEYMYRTHILYNVLNICIIHIYYMIYWILGTTTTRHEYVYDILNICHNWINFVYDILNTRWICVMYDILNIHHNCSLLRLFTLYYVYSLLLHLFTTSLSLLHLFTTFLSLLHLFTTHTREQVFETGESCQLFMERCQVLYVVNVVK